MCDLNFQIVGAEPERVAAQPTLLFKLQIAEQMAPGKWPTPIHAVVLRCQVQIEPARRTYAAAEKEPLVDLFGTPERWGKTVRPMLWTHVSLVVRPFTGTIAVDLPVPCSFDFSLAATKYFDALEAGEIPLCFLFSGTIFKEGDNGCLQVAQVPWDKEASFRLPASHWKALMDQHYRNNAWLCLRKDVFDRLSSFKSRRGLATWENTVDALLAGGKE